MGWRIWLTRPRDFPCGCWRSRIAWALACLHAAWFVLAIANMSPPSPGLGEFLDRGGWSSATLLAGKPFHYEYESLGLKLLILTDLPAMLAMLPVSLLLAPVSKVAGLSFYSNSYRLVSCWWLRPASGCWWGQG